MGGIKISSVDKLHYKRMDFFFVFGSLVAVGTPTLPKAFDYSTNKKNKK